jgi:hypothetical protein
MKEDEIKEGEGTQEVETPKGRAAMLSMYREDNPDFGEEDVDDDTLYNYAGSKLSDISGKYKDVTEANGKLTELIQSDPQLGLFLSLLLGGKSLPASLGEIFGKDYFSQSSEEMESGHKSYLEREAKIKEDVAAAQKNLEQYEKDLADYKKAEGMSEEDATKLDNAIQEAADNLLMGKIDRNFIEYIWKAINYDKDVQDALQTGEVQGKNATIDNKLHTSKKQPNLPKFGGGTSARVPRTEVPGDESHGRKSLSSQMEKVY